ncbi:uncharacterized protein N7496_003025 [Penicillium cataractarum]|uniref:Uncharacterized protein n=1 Tax=Penicillium cataractarum TaxID=2100454 RepID=A0A9W9SLR0_9EURO|nr:uncharacterized protein N7496_003025 [Penicillium cataractarum]KAJ5380597.1 hypothetical protein N7496_003025 [Penicillium cataractarum]
MFDLPDAKRVRRDEVQSPASSREPSPVDETDLQDAHARLGKLLDLDGLIGTNTAAEQDNNVAMQPADENNDEEEQEFEFRLFSAPTKPKDATLKDQEKTDGDRISSKGDKASGKDTKDTTAGTQKLRIRLRSPSPSGDPSEGRFVKAFRGWQYYFSTPTLFGLDENDAAKETIAEQRRQFEDMAVTGEHITTWAKAQPWPGCDLPWRVIHLKRHQTKLPPSSKDIPVYVVEGAPVSKSPITRKKPGKKRRVQLRKKVAAAVAAKESEAEKRNRKNRERKIKRRQKAREQKAAAAGAGGDGDVAMVDGDGDSSGGDE